MGAVFIVDDEAGYYGVYVDRRLQKVVDAVDGEQIGVLGQLGVPIGRAALDDDEQFPGGLEDLRFGEPVGDGAEISDLAIIDDQAGYYAFYHAGKKIGMTETLDHELWKAVGVPVRAMVEDALEDSEDFPEKLDGLLVADPDRPYLHGGLARLGATEDQMRTYHRLSTEFERVSGVDELTVENGGLEAEVYDSLEERWRPVTIDADGALTPNLLER